MKSKDFNKMTTQEFRVSLGLGSIYCFRMLGLFMILPVFSLYAQDIPYSTPFLIGLGLGIYGLTQALLQIPFGILSDHFGRKPIITLGLVLFAIGSIVAAFSHSIFGIIIGRALQGAGAIGSTLLALMADLTREENRSKAMALIGMEIGLAFFIAMVLGPLVYSWISVPGIFILTAGFAALGLFILHRIIPDPENSVFHREAETEPGQLLTILKNTELQRLNLGIFSLHALLTASFVVIPVLLHEFGLEEQQQWLLYLPVLLGSFVCMLPFMILAESKKCLKQTYVAAIVCLIAGLLIMAVQTHALIGLVAGLFLFLVAFSLLEAQLPSLISRIAPASSKGTAMGVYSAAQFFGIFVGGSAGGWIYGHYTSASVLLIGAILGTIWFLCAMTMAKPRQLSSYMLKLRPFEEQETNSIQQQLLDVSGVFEASVIAGDGVAYLKIDKQSVDLKNLHKFSMYGL